MLKGGSNLIWELVLVLYLYVVGLPLTTNSLTRLDIERLIDKVGTRFLSWTNKSLSFSVGLQLIKSVTTSITYFWCATFRFPSRCLDTTESMCGVFLGSGLQMTQIKLRLRRMKCLFLKMKRVGNSSSSSKSSRVFALSLIWRLLSLSSSLFVAWMCHYLLCYESFWDVNDGNKGCGSGGNF